MIKAFLLVGLAALISVGSYVALNTRHSTTSSSDAILSDFAFVANFEVKAAEFREWTKEHNKQYSLAELPMKFKVWSDNYDIVQHHNAKNLSWTLGMNHLADLTSEEHGALNLGFNPSLADSQDFEDSVQVLDDHNLTVNSIDWRSKSAVTAIRNQQQCGSCWAFAVSATLESLRKIKGGKLEYLSPQQLVDCSSSYGNQGCNGGTMVATYKYTVKNGIQTDSSYPYRNTQSTCRYSSSRVAYKHRSYKSVPNSYTQLQAAVSGQPVAVAVQADQSAFQLYKSGVITSGCGQNLNHAVVAVGFGSSYWIVKNSWGTGWGNKGYVNIAKSSANVCGINSMASYPTA